MKKLFLLLALSAGLAAKAQTKKPLDHSVYDQWQSLGERKLSPDGKWVVYNVNVQEGDATCYVQKTDGSYRYALPRGYMAQISGDGRFVAVKIKPPFAETRQARIKKKRPDEMPKDSLVVAELGTDSLRVVRRFAGVKTALFSDELAAGTPALLAIHFEKMEAPKPSPAAPDSSTRVGRLQRQADSLTRVADSLRRTLAEVQAKGLQVLNNLAGRPTPARPAATADEGEEGTDLMLFNPANETLFRYPRVQEFAMSKQGQMAVLEVTKKKGDTSSKAAILRIAIEPNAGLRADTILLGLNDAKNLTLSDNGNMLAFVAERDSAKKDSKKFWGLHLHRNGDDSAQLLVGRRHPAMRQGYVVSENGRIRIGQDEQRLMFGLAVDLPEKDTSLPEFERVSVDVWHYKDDYLQTTQLFNLNRELRRSYPALISLSNPQKFDLLSDSSQSLYDRYRYTMDARHFYLLSDTGRRVASQWQGFIRQDLHVLNPDGSRKLLIKNLKGNILPSPTGNFCLVYDEVARRYSMYNAATGKISPIGADIKFPLYDEDNDVPDDPNAYGPAYWTKAEDRVMISDRYDLYAVDVLGQSPSLRLTNGRAGKQAFRLVNLDDERESIAEGDTIFVRSLLDSDKEQAVYAGVYTGQQAAPQWQLLQKGNFNYTGLTKAKAAPMLVFGEERFSMSPRLVSLNYGLQQNRLPVLSRSVLATTNPQQQHYNWGNAELFRWKAYTGRLTEGIVYKPEDFDPAKKYPMLIYFYERNSETLNAYQAPAPTPSRLNIPFFVSRGYVVFVPDVWYTTGKPGQSAYDYIVSGTRALTKLGFVDSTRMGIQGQSWGGYQVAHLITRTNLYKAAWAGAPVANMTSAYGGIRWESGLNRQFQYERQQSRIGATLWEKPNLYIENSPLFYLPKVNTPLVIMANDADGAVPWYQGIELFTGLRRLGKPVWMLNYNGEAHNLVERKNRKDIQVREQQFFDWLLMGAPPAPWLEKGVPAVLKGRVTKQ